MEPGGSLPHSQEPATCPYPKPAQSSSCLCRLFRNIIIFYGEELLAPRQTPKLEDHPLSAVRECLFNVFAATLRNRRPFLHPQPADAPCRGDTGPLMTLTDKPMGLYHTDAMLAAKQDNPSPTYCAHIQDVPIKTGQHAR
jgi:hypothetical protein